MIATTSPRKYSRFCGIDVAKSKHVACVIDRDGGRYFAVEMSGGQPLESDLDRCAFDRAHDEGRQV